MSDTAASSERKRHALSLFEGLPARYDRLGAVMSFGQDPRWRTALVQAIDPQPGMRVLDVATGTGMVAFALAERGCTVVGIDQSPQMLAVAEAKLRDAGGLGERISFVRGQAERLPFEAASFDALTFTYLLRYVDDKAATLSELARVLRPGGRIGMVEFAVPGSPLARSLWRLYTRLGLPLIGRLVSPAWQDVGHFLGPSIEQLYAQDQDMSALWRQAGIEHVQERRMSFGAGLVMSGVRA